MYLLDTNICIELLAGNSRVTQQLSSLGRVRLFIPSISVGELTYGAMRCARPAHEMAQVRRLLHHMAVAPVDWNAALEYGILKAHLAAQGQLLEDNDLFIASIALSKGLILVTHDKGFARVPNLVTEDWVV